MSGVTQMCYQPLIHSMSLWPKIEKTQSNDEMSSFLALLFHCLCCSYQTNFLLSLQMTYILSDSSIQFFKRRVGCLLVLQIFIKYFILLCEKFKDYFSLLLAAIH